MNTEGRDRKGMKTENREKENQDRDNLDRKSPESGNIKDRDLPEEREALFRISHVKGLYSDRLWRLYGEKGSFREVLKGLESEQSTRNGTQEKRTFCQEKKPQEDRAVRFVTIFDREYPRRLKCIQNPPPFLYVRGNLPSDKKPSAAVIGARDCSEYGRSMAEYFAAELSAAGIQIVSGLAFGVDSAAADGSLNRTGESYAVLGSGIKVCYPHESYPLFERICEGRGGILSEFAPDAGPLRHHFVIRNRLIAGLADVVLVMEAGEKSGTSITVGYALEQGKDIFALPGRITDRLGRGCNRFIREGAMILTDPEDVLDYFDLTDRQLCLDLTGDNGQDSLPPELQSVLKVLDYEPEHVEAIAFKAQLDMKTCGEALCLLEQMGLAKEHSGAHYRRMVPVAGEFMEK